jgi:long-chain acyl-CoA synthetase
MFSRATAQATPNHPAIIMASTGKVITHGELEARANQLAHALRNEGLGRGDHFALFMENNDKFLEICSGGERTGVYYTPVNSYLTADELAYIVQNSESQVLIASKAKRDIAAAAAEQCPNLKRLVLIDADADDPLFTNYDTWISSHPTTPIADEDLGISMLYSSGTTGRPKGILRPMIDSDPGSPLPLWTFLDGLWKYRDGLTYLSPAPLYHSAPQAAVGLTIRRGGTVVVMEHFDPEQYLSLIEKYKVTHSQLVPTMFSRMLKLPEEVRTKYDLSSLEVAIHAAAPCPVPVKEQMIAWWGPIIDEYYGATEGLGFAACNTEEWLAHRGTVGKMMIGELHILDDDMNPAPKGEPGTLWFKSATEFSYFNDTEKTKESTSADGVLTTVGDVGYVDDDGFLFLTDRATFMIISGGVNIYPQECENLLITHPKVADAAVFGVPNVDLGEEVKGVVQLMPGFEPSAEIERELIDFCHEHLARQKCPRSIDFEAELPRLPTGKLYKKPLRERYWANKKTRIV